MNIIEAIQRRHSVRQYLEKEIPEEIVERLLAAMRACNQVGGLHMHLVLHEPEAFSGLRSKAMRFRGVENYIILAGEKDDTLEERCGYYGEKVVLLAQQLGLNTCWVGSTFKKKPECYNLAPGEKVVAAIAIGYGANQGKSRKSKSMCDVSDGTEVSLTHGHEPAELLFRAVRKCGFRGSGKGPFHQGGPGHREMPFRNRRRKG